MMGEVRVLVVGASGGIGRHVALALAQPGVELVVHGRREDERLASLVREVQERGSEPRTVIREIERADDILQDIRAWLPLDVVVVSFGPMLRKAVVDTEVHEWRRMAELNFVLPAAVVAACLPSMTERGYGRILLFGGTGTEQVRGFRSIAAYSAAKTALGSVVKSVARQTAGHDICINGLCPGFVDTEYYGEAERRHARSLAPGGEMIDPEEVARLAAYLLSRENRGTTGAVIPVDGGRG
ncbi:MAG: SDR family NAD(P)-dependent oxidoreductase [Spirochaetaceae bacterium]